MRQRHTSWYSSCGPQSETEGGMNPLSPGSKAHYVHIWLSSPDSLQERCTWVQINLAR